MINLSTSTKEVWNQIGAIEGSLINSLQKLITHNQTFLTDSNDKALAFTPYFEKHPQNENYHINFQQFKKAPESTKLKLEFGEDTDDAYNVAFTLIELSVAIQTTRATTVGPDELHTNTIKKAPTQFLQILLSLFNKIGHSGVLPLSWNSATVIPILKPNKNPKLLDSYCPILLTSVLSKVFECIVNQRLIFELQKKALLSPNQLGFRSSRSTIDGILQFQGKVN